MVGKAVKVVPRIFNHLRIFFKETNMKVEVKKPTDVRIVKAKQMKIGQIGYVRSGCSHNGTLVLRGYECLSGLDKPNSTWDFAPPPCFDIELIPAGSVVCLTVED
jgi:hypothetical protein